MSDSKPLQNDGGGGGGGDDGFLQFLNTKDTSSDYTVVNASNPLEWVGVTQAFLGSVLGGIALGIQYGINGLVDAAEGLTDGLSSFVDDPATGVVPTAERGLSVIYTAALEAPEGLGWLSWPVYVLELLVAAYIVVWAIQYAREEVL